VVSRVAGNRVMLGIEAPSDVRIIRAELKSFDEPNAAAPAASKFEDAAEAARASVPQLAK
jgi:sRNA-binding carbon storage regulator CsrA